MSQFRKKPVVIEAVQLRWDTWSEMCDHAGVGKLADGKPQGCYVREDGTMQRADRDWRATEVEKARKKLWEGQAHSISAAGLRNYYELERLRAALRKYGTHRLGCASGEMKTVPQEWPEPASWEPAGKPCNCGFDEVSGSPLPDAPPEP